MNKREKDREAARKEREIERKKESLRRLTKQK